MMMMEMSRIKRSRKAGLGHRPDHQITVSHSALPFSRGLQAVATGGKKKVMH